MQYRTLAAPAAFALLAMLSLASAPDLQAQHAAVLSALSQDRALRWASASEVIHCGPAPLTERPGIQSELSRPHVTPLESAFADAAIVKRAVASLRIRNER